MFLKPNIKSFHLFNSDGAPHTQFIKQCAILRFLLEIHTTTLEGTLSHKIQHPTTINTQQIYALGKLIWWGRRKSQGGDG